MSIVCDLVYLILNICLIPKTIIFVLKIENIKTLAI